jgi:Asp/Glu/hydantoin racemase
MPEASGKSELPTRNAFGGKTIYGARVGILVLDTCFPRIPGDVANALTWPFPVLFRVVRGATTQRLVHEQGDGLSPLILAAAAELVRDGADGIATTGGFMGLFQKELAAHCQVPVATSSVMQVPWVQSILPPGKRVGVVTAHGERLDGRHLLACGAPADTPVVGTERGSELTRAFVGGELEADIAKVEADVLQAADEMMTKHDNIGALVLECHNMAPYSRLLQSIYGIPIFDVYSFVCWFHSGLAPRDFGYPGSGVPTHGWRERL